MDISSLTSDLEEEGGDSSGSKEPRPEYISIIEAQGLGKFRVICPTTMERLGILNQFHELTDAIGIRAFLYALRDCKTYREPTITFLSTFHYEGRVIRFRISDDYHEMSLDEQVVGW
ncbi:hypothetical protein FCM35_KLT05048 [Carex littledalei]|uniref:Arabidopsis retrotransposon Orf1 C-terminal domain-containing protein n=1 Tax=Carex littledalei TaxID=544730 RepID=A0A833QZI4_9POAL|nr:hypothetical protein FCM35_KLT05048 [Carex littledalei]